MMQKDMKKLIAYSSVSHMGFCTLGIFALTPLGLSGSIIQQVNHGISTGALFLIVGRAVRTAPHALDLGIRRALDADAEFCGGVFDRHAQFARHAAVERVHRRIHHSARRFRSAVAMGGVGRAGSGAGRGVLLWLYQRVMFGNVTNPLNEHLPDLNGREFATLVTLIILAFWIGIYPAPLFNVLDKPVKQIVLRYDPNYYTPQTTAGVAPAQRRASMHIAAAE